MKDPSVLPSADVNHTAKFKHQFCQHFICCWVPSMKRRLHPRSDTSSLSPLSGTSTGELSQAKTHTPITPLLSPDGLWGFRPSLSWTPGMMQWYGDALRPAIPQGLEKGKVTLHTSLASSTERGNECGENPSPAPWGAAPRHPYPPPALPLSPIPAGSGGNQPSVGFEATDFPFPPRFACHLRKRSSGLSGDDTISLGTVPPCSGMYRYSGIQMDPGCLPPPPPAPPRRGCTPIAGHAPGGAAPVKTSAPSARISAPRARNGAAGLGHPSPAVRQGGGAGTGSGGAALHNARQDGGAGPGHGQRRSRSAAALARSLALPDANVPLWRRSARPWLLFGSVGTCGRASLSSSHTGCGAETAGVKILGL